VKRTESRVSPTFGDTSTLQERTKFNVCIVERVLQKAIFAQCRENSSGSESVPNMRLRCQNVFCQRNPFIIPMRSFLKRTIPIVSVRSVNIGMRVNIFFSIYTIPQEASVGAMRLTNRFLNSRRGRNTGHSVRAVRFAFCSYSRFDSFSVSKPRLACDRARRHRIRRVCENDSDGRDRSFARLCAVVKEKREESLPSRYGAVRTPDRGIPNRYGLSLKYAPVRKHDNDSLREFRMESRLQGNATNVSRDSIRCSRAQNPILATTGR
jgi:hypothetical protein